MSTTLVTSASVPLDQPYDSVLYDGTTREFDRSFSVSSFPDGTVDWMLLSLRTGPDVLTSVDTALAFLHSDGTIVGPAGSDTVEFQNAPADSLFLVVRHRNHLSVMSSSKLDFIGGQPATWDFTTGVSQAYTTGPSPMKDLGDGSFGMFTGDYSIDEQITASDFNLWLVDTKAVATGYLQTDANFDAQATANDFNLWLVNTKAVVTSQVP
jgi:hypothetical protein